MTVEHIAIRGSRLSLTHARWVDEEQPGSPVTIELVGVMEVDDAGLHRENVAFDPDDIDAAFAELEARYLAGEAATHAETWLGLMDAYAAFNRGEVPAVAAQTVDIDHRPLAPIASGDLLAYLDKFVSDLAGLRTYAESVHRLSDSAAVVTHVAVGTSQSGFDAEWRMVYFATLKDRLINRGEIFEEADLDVATARFDELSN